MRKLKKNSIISIAILLTLIGVFLVNALYMYLRMIIIQERDEQIFSLAYSVDSNIHEKLNDIMNDLDISLKDAKLENLEKNLFSTEVAASFTEEGVASSKEEVIASFTEFLKESHVFSRKDIEGIVIFDGDRQIYSLNHTDDSTDYTYTFIQDLDEDSLFVCYDQYGKYSVALEKKSPYSTFRYYILVDLNHFYDTIVPEELQKSNWIVFYEEECGLLLQNHDNQDPWLILSDEEIEERNDGYTIIRKYQLLGTMGAETYKYPNYYGQMVRERIITLPQKMTSNGYFSIGISRDCETLYKSLDRVRMLTVLILILLVLCTTHITRYILRIRQKAIHDQLEMEAKLKEKKLRDQLDEARLQNSIHQLQPHFLYNALSSIREIVLEAPDYAADLLLDFTNYLRFCLRAMNSNDLVPFSQELKNIEAYVNIEKMRLGDKLTVIFDIQEYDFDIIPLGIQPLVENAIRHGICKKRGKTGTVWIRTQKTDSCIEVIVEDNGIGFDLPAKKHEVDNGLCDSTGLKNLVFRFKETMGATVVGSSIIGTGTKIVIRIPDGDRHPQGDRHLDGDRHPVGACPPEADTI